MSASSTNKFRKSYSLLTKSLGADITDSATTATLNNYTSIPTDTGVDMIIDRIDSNGNATPTKREIVTVVCNGSGLASMVRGVHGTTAQAHSSGAVVELIASGAAWNDAMSGILVEHAQDGTHGGITATSIDNSGTTKSDTIAEHTTDNGVTIDSLKIKDGAIVDSNSNEEIKFTATASAVNEITITNAATGNNPQISATGGDTNIGLKGVPKGTGINQGFLAVKAGQYTSVSSNTTYKISGLGFTPKIIQFFYGTSQGFSSTHYASFGYGYYDANSGTQGAQSGTTVYGSGAGTSSGTPNGTPTTSYCLVPVTNSGTPNYTGAVTATDSDSFTITVTNYNASANFFWIAFG